MPNYHTEQDEALITRYENLKFKKAANAIVLSITASSTYVESLLYLKDYHTGRPVFLGACALGAVGAGIWRRSIKAEAAYLDQISVALVKSALSIEAAHLALDREAVVFETAPDEEPQN